MVVQNLLKASLLTAIFLLAAMPVQAESSNPEDGSQPEAPADEQGPCSFLILDYEAPFVDYHPECLEQLPGNGRLFSFASH